jgi:hypothetical protein
MTPAAIINQALADGVRLVLSSTGSIKAAGRSEAVNRWLPVIREHKAELLDELRAANDCPYEALPDAAAERRRQRVLAMLTANPSLRIAVVCDGAGDPVPVAIAIRDKATCEVLIPRDRYDGALLLDLIDRHSGTVQ